MGVRNYGEAIDFYSRKLNFDLIEDLYGNLRDPVEPALYGKPYNSYPAIVRMIFSP